MEICFLMHVLLLFNVALAFVGLMPRKKVQRELFTKKKNGETETKRAHDNLRISKLQEIFNSGHRVSSLRENSALSNKRRSKTVQTNRISLQVR